MRRLLPIAACLSGLCLFATLNLASAQATIHVPADQPTIQAGIDAAQTGDTVLVSAGTYHEHIDFKGKAITVASASGPDTTIIDGDLTATVVRFHTIETSASVLQGFTVRHGKEAQNSFTEGGGISIVSSSPTISGNVIVDNQGCDGDGIYVQSGSPVIQNNVISRNTQTTCSGGNGGGGIGLLGGNNTKIIGNIITDNVNYAFGGGIGMNGGGTPRIEANYIARNTSSQGGGIGMVNSSSPTFVNNVIVSNKGSQGGGVYFALPSGAKPIFLNNTFADNDAPSSSALFASPFDTVLVTNNIIAAKTGQTAIFCQQFNATVSPVFSYNDVYSSGGALYAGICSDQTGSNGNVSADPLFSNAAAGDYHLSFNSPAIDIGNNLAPGMSSTDYDQNPRIVIGKTGGNAIVDLGALEYQGATTMTVSPSSLTFAAQKVGTRGDPQALTVTNTGSRTLRLKPFAIGADFTETDNCVGPSGVAPGASCAVNVVFVPATAGPHAESVVITGSNVVDAPSTVSVTGTGTAPAISVVPSSLTFSDQFLYTTSAAQTVTVTNIGDAGLVIGSIAASGDFSQTNNCGTLAPNAACTISVTFTPTVTKTRTGAIAIQDDAAGSPHAVSLTGNGVGPEISFSPTALYFTPQSAGTISNPLPVTVTNTGGYDLVISSVQITGDYSIQSNNCVATLAAGGSCQVSVQFLPTATGPRAGSLTFADNASASPQTVALSGQGTAPILQAYLTSAFPTTIYTATTSQAFAVLKNIGSEPLIFTSITVAGDSFSQTNNCTAPLGIGSSCWVTITFTPTSAGTLTGALSISSNALGSPATLNFSATALAAYPVPTLTSMTPTALTIGSGSTTLTVTGTNFYPATTIALDGVTLTTAFVSSTRLTATIPSTLTSDFGEHAITVTTPSPGGGSSAALPLLVYRAVQVSARDMVYDRFRKLFYATVASGSPQYVNNIVIIDPRTGAVTPLIDLGAEGDRLAISDDAEFLWVGIDSAHVVKRLNLYSQVIDITIPLGTSGFLGPYVAGTIFPLPGSPRSAAITLNVTTTTTPPDKLVIYDDDVPRPNSYGGGWPTFITTVSDPTVLYVGSSSVSPPTLNVFKLDATGVTLTNSKWNSGMGYITSDGSHLFSA